jgi:DNA mismatch repair protein MutS2
MPFALGQSVVVRRLGKGVVREVRRHGQYLVALGATTIVCDEQDLSIVASTGKKKRAPERTDTAASPVVGRATAPAIDLHGLTVEQALQIVDDRLNAAMLAGVESMDVIHGKGGGKIRAALHRHLSGITTVRYFELDARNPGVTHVYL